MEETITKLALRKVAGPDMLPVFDWANDPVTRANSFNQAPISRTEHTAWFMGIITDSRRRFYMIEADGVRVGVLRYEPADPVTDGHRWEVSITVAPEHRGRGIANRALREGNGMVQGRILARVKPDNFASRRAFTHAGYRLDAEDEDGTLRYVR